MEADYLDGYDGPGLLDEVGDLEDAQSPSDGDAEAEADGGGAVATTGGSNTSWWEHALNAFFRTEFGQRFEQWLYGVCCAMEHSQMQRTSEPRVVQVFAQGVHHLPASAQPAALATRHTTRMRTPLPPQVHVELGPAADAHNVPQLPRAGLLVDPHQVARQRGEEPSHRRPHPSAAQARPRQPPPAPAATRPTHAPLPTRSTIRPQHTGRILR
mmetsp:Transcript_4909/g.13298  ORF Transcript_4909/g.13298 Transcript_4909/m.13298 type:complete len:213 (+) Transcript_4909:215-853(+)